MSNLSPVFPIADSQHFSDYGFDPQVHYFQVMEEARKYKRETSTKSSINGLQLKIQKPISKEDPTQSTMHNNKRKKRCWWKKALPFFKLRKGPISTVDDRRVRNIRNVTGSMSGPIYATESRSGSNTPYRIMTTRKPFSGPIAGTLTPVKKHDVATPYLSLRELNMEQKQRISTSSSMPIYLVT